jgi:regulatory protein
VNLEDARALAYAHLNRRERTEQELREHLLKRGADERIADAVVLELAEQDYLDDHRFVRLFAQDKRELGGWGTGRIRRALIDRGIAPEVVDSALEEMDHAAQPRLAAAATQSTTAPTAPRAQELSRALALLRRRFPQAPATNRERNRALGVLMRKGYDYELAVDALAEHVRNRDGDDAVAPPCPRY